MSAFGDFLRAGRLGYRQVPLAGGMAWLRIEAGGPPYRVTLARDAKDMGELDRDAGRMHVCWWEDGGNGSAIVAASPVLSALRVEALPLVLWLDDDGARVSVSTKGGDRT